MTVRIGLFAAVAAAAVALTAVTPMPASFADDTVATTIKPVVHKNNKKKKKHVARKHNDVAYPELEPYRSHGFIGKFPGSCAYDRAAGTCMIDLGYGRCVPCSIGGGSRF